MRPLAVFGWLAYAVLFAMLGLPLWDWASGHSGRLVLAIPAIVGATAWLLRRPLWVAALGIGLGR